MKNKPWIGAGAIAVCLLACSSPMALAEDGKKALLLELNNAQNIGKSCRLSFVITNKMPAAIENLALEIVLFDGEGLVDQFLKLKTGPLPEGKTRVKRFDFKGKACSGLSKILINEISECKGENLSPKACAAALSINSRTKIKLSL